MNNSCSDNYKLGELLSVIVHIRTAVCKGKLFHFDFTISCADIQLRLFIYISSSIDELSRIILNAWMLMSYIIYSLLPVLQFGVFVFFIVNSVKLFS